MALITIAAAGNLAATLDRQARAGLPFAPWIPLLDEVSSSLVWLALAPVVVLVFRLLSPPRVRWIFAAPLHLVVAALVSLAHYGLTRLLRAVAHVVSGQDFQLPVTWAGYVGDLYRDGLTYVLLGLVYCGAHALLVARNKPTESAVGSVLEVRDGAQTVYVPVADILWVEAAGNYVELHTVGDRAILMRTTLAGIGERLESLGFLRIHRSRLVNTVSVTSIESHASGDATLLLTGGKMVSASRRYRPMLTMAMASRVKI
ncbi:LytTR family DNA-binding domain-containing protein [Caulobacter sp. RHG1]|uniref:LytTR family DNA-binding domain-containing protein n=1 Tax=Caulobacter sp. (strain RHG1) TaxID=2545762 RepID=UPI001556478A|nr:hypothetical protein [Caulobacter sp. RHG1]